MEAGSSSVTTASYLPINLASNIRKLGTSTQFSGLSLGPTQRYGSRKIWTRHKRIYGREKYSPRHSASRWEKRRFRITSRPLYTRGERPGYQLCGFQIQHGRFGERYHVSYKNRTTILRTWGGSLIITPTERCRNDVGPRDSLNHRT